MRYVTILIRLVTIRQNGRCVLNRLKPTTYGRSVVPNISMLLAQRGCGGHSGGHSGASAQGDGRTTTPVAGGKPPEARSDRLCIASSLFCERPASPRCCT